jgi:hypothetical protein
MERNAKESPLISLPPEIRNRIFQFAYSSRVYFLIIKGNIIASSSGMKLLRSNNAQRACRQLRLETHGLEYKLNNPYKILAPLFKRMCRAKDKRLQNITNRVHICGDMRLKENPDEVLLHDMILDLAWKNPKAKISVQVIDLHFDTTRGRTLQGFFSLAGVILMAMRGQIRHGVPSKSIKNWQRRKSIGQLNAPNLRFVPAKSFFEEEKFRRLASGDGSYLKGIVLPHYGNDLERLVEEVKGWYKNGL